MHEKKVRYDKNSNEEENNGKNDEQEKILMTNYTNENCYKEY